jgi:hypothetical protein
LPARRFASSELVNGDDAILTVAAVADLAGERHFGDVGNAGNLEEIASVGGKDRFFCFLL